MFRLHEYRIQNPRQIYSAICEILKIEIVKLFLGKTSAEYSETVQFIEIVK